MNPRWDRENSCLFYRNGLRTILRAPGALCAFCTLLSLPVHPQNINSISGVVRGTVGAAILGAPVKLTGSAIVGPDHLPPRREIHAIMRRVNSWQSAHPVMKPEDRNWQRATWYTGVVAAWKATGDESFLKQAWAWGKQHDWQVGTEPDGANRLFCVQTWLELYLRHKKDLAMVEHTIRWLDTSAPNSPGGGGRWYLEDNRVYADSLYGAPALAMLTRATGNSKYLEIMEAFFDDVTAQLWDEQLGLYYRDDRFKEQFTANGKKIFWSRGNGWVFAGIPRILDYLPADDARRARYVGIFRRMASELIKRQQNDGLWRANLDDPQEVPNPETSGTAFFCFGLAWGINNGILDPKEYEAPVVKAFTGLLQSVSSEGKVQWGQPVDWRPNPALRESTHEFVSGTFLLAASEVYKMRR